MSGEKPPYANGPWTVEAVRTVFDNPWIRVSDESVVRPDGSPGEYGVVHFKNRAIGVLPIDADGRVPLVGQHRYPLRRYSWELPEGGGPLTEDPVKAAKRELLEETGFSANAWHELASFDVSNSVTDEIAVCFLASELEAGAPAPEPTEVLQFRSLAFSELQELVLCGEIRDALTIIMVLMAYAKAKSGALPQALTRLILGVDGR